jgi:hypothetical protein
MRQFSLPKRREFLGMLAAGPVALGLKATKSLPSAGDILKEFYVHVIDRDLAGARKYLKDDLVFVGVFETYRGADAYMTSLSGLLQITVRLDVKKIMAERNDAAIFFELQTKAPAEGKVLVAEWHHFTNGKISHVESAFDARPYAAMFTAGTHK